MNFYIYVLIILGWVFPAHSQDPYHWSKDAAFYRSDVQKVGYVRPLVEGGPIELEFGENNESRVARLYYFPRLIEKSTKYVLSSHTCPAKFHILPQISCVVTHRFLHGTLGWIWENNLVDPNRNGYQILKEIPLEDQLAKIKAGERNLFWDFMGSKSIFEAGVGDLAAKGYLLPESKILESQIKSTLKCSNTAAAKSLFQNGYGLRPTIYYHELQQFNDDTRQVESTLFDPVEDPEFEFLSSGEIEIRSHGKKVSFGSIGSSYDDIGESFFLWTEKVQIFFYYIEEKVKEYKRCDAKLVRDDNNSPGTLLDYFMEDSNLIEGKNKFPIYFHKNNLMLRSTQFIEFITNGKLMEAL